MCLRCAARRKRAVIASIWAGFLAVLVWAAIRLARENPTVFREFLPEGTIAYVVLAVVTINLAAWLFDRPPHPCP